jgi:plastocyanin
MQARRFLAAPLLCAFLALPAIGVAGCGGSDSGTSPPATSESDATTAGESESDATASEPGDDSGGNSAAPSGDAVRSAEVEIEDFAYDPDPVTIEEGGKVIWKNRDSAPHTATAAEGSFDTGTIEEDKLESETFKQPGTYAYVCSIHPQMHGTVEVVAAG